MRSEYISQCSRIGNVSEHVLIGELNKELRKKYKRNEEQPTIQQPEEAALLQPAFEEDDADAQECDIIRLLLNYHSHQISFPKNETVEATDGTTEWISVPVAEYIIEDLERDEIMFGNSVFSLIYSELKNRFAAGQSLAPDYFLNHRDDDVRELATDLLSEPHELSDNWSRHGITVPTEENVLREAVEGSLYSLKIRKVMKMLRENRRQMDVQWKKGDDIIELMGRQHRLETLKMKLSLVLGIDVLK